MRKPAPSRSLLEPALAPSLCVWQGPKHSDGILPTRLSSPVSHHAETDRRITFFKGLLSDLLNSQPRVRGGPCAAPMPELLRSGHRSVFCDTTPHGMGFATREAASTDTRYIPVRIACPPWDESLELHSNPAYTVPVFTTVVRQKGSANTCFLHLALFVQGAGIV